MNKIYSIALMSLMLASCGNTTDNTKSIDDIIAEKNIEAIKTKKTSVLKEYDKISADLAKLEKALSDLDTVKAYSIVTSFKVENQLFKHYVNIQGDVQTKQNIIIYPEFPGVLKEVLVTEGQYVKKGQLLAKIDDGGLSQQLAQLEVQTELSKTTFDRQKRLWEQKIGSEIQYLQAKAAYESQIKAVEQLKSQLEKTHVKAPFNGVVDDIISEQGQVVAPGQSPLIRIVNLNNMYVKAEVPEVYIGKIKKGSEVQVSFQSLGKTIQSKVRQVGSFINPANRTFTIEVAVPNKDKMIKPNLIATLKINDYTNEKALIIPDDVIQENAQGQKFVYVLTNINGNNEANLQKAEITTGVNYNNFIEVKSGLNANTLIVKEGAKSMREGLTVKIN